MNVLLAHFYSPSLDLIMLILAVAADALLAFIVFLSAPKSATNRIFSLLTVCTMCWLAITYVVRLPELIPYSLILHRLGIFFAAPMSALFFLLAHTMPAPRLRLARPWFWAIVAATLLMMGFNLSPYAFTGYVLVGGASEPVPGLGLLPFSVLSTLFSLLTIWWLTRSYRRAKGAERRQIGFMLSGVAVMLALIIATILFPIILYGSLGLLAFTPLYALAFLGMTAYAITEYQLFSIKVLVTQALTFVLGIVLFARLFGEATPGARFIDALVLAVVSIFGFFLVKSVKREVEQRERIERLAAELAATNERQENLIHFIGHEVKGFLTKAEDVFAELLDGDFGALPEALRPLTAEALAQTRDGVASVSDILKAANMKKGTVAFKKEPFDLKALAQDELQKAASAAAAKNLALTFAAGEGKFGMVGDTGEMGEHVLRNLIDNAVAYTPHGSVAVSLVRLGARLVLSVKDTGIGISPEDKARLFTEGGHGKDSMKVNVHSTGYGLYIAKNVVEAHGGTIRVESEGPGKGATFIVELPAESATVPASPAAPMSAGEHQPA